MDTVKYDVDYFITKFSNISDDMWIKSHLGTTKHCALGHCGVVSNPTDGYVMTEESNALIVLFGGDLSSNNPCQVVYKVNDDDNDHPKRNILKKLLEIINKK